MALFRRKKTTEQVPDEAVLADETTDEAERTAQSGPWDDKDFDGSREGYVDFGHVMVRPIEGASLSFNPTQNYVEFAFPAMPAAVRLELRAAPKSSGLWDDLRADAMVRIAHDGGASREHEGEWGPFLQAQLATGRTQAGVPVRMCGIDGPRWTLLVTAFDRAAMDERIFSELAHAVLDDCIVVRGQKPYPPGDTLELTAPSLHLAGGETQHLAAGPR